MTDYSVIIPTYNRMDVLPEVLAALERQRDAPTFEILVVDDGSTDGTGEWLRERAATGRAATGRAATSRAATGRAATSAGFRVLSQPNQGPAAARNRGVEAAAGERVAFLGDDTVPSAGWLAAHAHACQSHPDEPLLAVIGYTGWHPRMRLTPFLRYINDYGLQFGYAIIDEPDDVPFNFFYTSNLSLPRAALLQNPFDLSFPYAAWEDIEVSYRLKQRGMRLVYTPQARVAHDHPTDLERFTGRQEKAGYSAVVFYLLHPELGSFLGLGPEGPPPLPRRWRQRLRENLACGLQKLSVRTPGLWEDVLRYHYIRGLHRGWKDRVRSEKEADHED